MYYVTYSYTHTLPQMDFYFKNPSDHYLPSYIAETSWHLRETFLARPQLVRGLKISLRACCGLDEGKVSAFPMLLPPQNQSRGVHTDTQGHGAPSETCARDKKSPLPADRLSQHLSLASCFLLPPCKIEARISTEPCCRRKGGWEAVLRTFFLNLFCGGKCHTAKGTGGEKLKWEISYWNILEVCQAPRPLGVRIHNDGITGWERIKNNIFMSILWGYKCHWNMGIWPQMKTT